MENQNANLQELHYEIAKLLERFAINEILSALASEIESYKKAGFELRWMAAKRS